MDHRTPPEGPPDTPLSAPLPEPPDGPRPAPLDGLGDEPLDELLDGPGEGPGDAPPPDEAEDTAEPAPEGRGSPVGRRVVLGMLGLGAVGVGVGGAVQDRLDSVLASVSAKDPTGVTALLPGGGGFRFYSVSNSVPHRGENDYRLTVGGLVDHPAGYRLADLRALPQTRLVRDVQCVTGWRVPHTAFSGVRLSTLLEAAGVRKGAAAVRFTCFDGVYTESLTLDQARRDDVLVALAMNDRPVSTSHGGPVRLYVAPMYFYKSAKWLSGITVTKDVRPGYWEHYGYDVDGWVGTSNGRRDDPTS